MNVNRTNFFMMKSNKIYIDDSIFEGNVYQDKTENNVDIFNDTGICKAVRYHNVPDPNDPEQDPSKVKRIPEVIIDMIALHEYLHMTKEMITAGFPLLKKYLGNQDGEGGLDVVVTDDITTAATDGQHIFFSPLFVWKLAHTNALNRNGELNGWDYVDEGIVFVYMHEIYHCMFLHHLRETKFGKNRKGGVDHQKANIVEDQEINAQLEAYCGFDQTLKGNLQVGTVNLMNGILFNSKGEDMNLVPEEFEKLIYNPEFTYIGEDYDGNDMKYKRRYPTKFGAQWEEMYEWFEEHGWPKAQAQQHPFTQQQGGQGQSQDQQIKGDQDIYDEGYYDGYRGFPDKSSKSTQYDREDYKAGYEDGQKWAAYDKENNSCYNDPDYLAGKEWAEKNVTENSIDNYSDSLLEAFKNINTESDAYRKAIEDYRNQRGNQKPNQSNQNNSQGNNKNQNDNINRRENQQQGQQQSSGQQQGQQQGGSNIDKRGQESQENGQGESQGQGQGSSTEQGGQGNELEGQGSSVESQNQNGKSGSNGKINRHQGVGSDGKPVNNKGNQGGQGQLYDDNNPYDINRKCDPDDFDWGKMRDQLSEEEGREITQKLGRLSSDKQQNTDKKWKNKVLKNGLQGLPDGGDFQVDPGMNPPHGCGKEAGIWATMERIKEAMKSTVNWQDMLMGYIKGAFKASRDRINKKSYNNPEGIISKIERDNGGDSIGHVAFSIDNSGSMWGKGSAAFEKFFAEISKIRAKIGRPIKAVVTFPFTAGESCFYADYFKDGDVKPDKLSVDKNGGTDFNQIFTLMKAGEVYNKKTKKKIWRGINDVVDFPVVTVIMTDGEDDVPKRDTSWDFDRHCLIWFVINTNQGYIDSFREQLMKKGYNAKYYIGITTDQI